MADGSNDPNVAQWALGGLTAMLGLAFGWLWTRVEGLDNRTSARIAESANSAATHIATGDRELWAALNSERQRAEDFRAKILEHIGGLPTKADLEAMERRLSQRIDRHP